ncbi:MAG TPA: hypothetical protein VGQ94_01795 [Terriglobales bacterium]|nr:hypothetical protein [Terriglobales bacterium]
MQRIWRLTVAVVLILAVLAPSLAARKKRIPLLLNSGVTAELPSPAAATAVQTCENWAWAAGVETILRTQNVALDQHYWVQKSDAGEICLESLASLEKLSKVVTGEYVLDDSRKVRLEARYTVSAPVNLDSIILSLRGGQPAILVWKGHAYVLYGVVYDEYISPTGNRFFDIRELKLIDPYYAEDDRRLVSFVRDRDDPADIGGTFEINVAPITPTDWLHRN